MTDFSDLILRPDHEDRPLWLTGDYQILLDSSSPIHKEAQDFVVAIANPVSRPELIHEYQLTPYALYAAVSIGIDSKSIIRTLQKFCKTELPENLAEYVRKCTLTCGKAKLVLRNGKTMVQTMSKNCFKYLTRDRIVKELIELDQTVPSESNTKPHKEQFQSREARSENATLSAIKSAIRDEDDEDLRNALAADYKFRKKIQKFQVKSNCVEKLKRRAIEINCPLMEEYDFRSDNSNLSINIDLKPSARIRPYQKEGLQNMFGNGLAKSGVIVLPCGGGKSLVGVTAACTVKKRTLVLCTNTVSVDQWKGQFATWSTISEGQIGKFVSAGGSREKIFIGDVTVSTYSMISHTGSRSEKSKKLFEQIKNSDWGLLLLDEVHVAPADMFRKVIDVIRAHCKLGLTATLLREDDKIQDISFLIGPKLYEANWLDLQKKDYLANVKCHEIWCPMTQPFYQEYLRSKKKRTLLCAMNPCKFQACQELLRYHETLKHKIIIFVDNIFTLKIYEKNLNVPAIYGSTSHAERKLILENFKKDPNISTDAKDSDDSEDRVYNTIILSKVGDTSIDIPEANVLIQVSSHYGSRRQEVQRLGRVLRKKPRTNDEEFNAFFYSLVSKDTVEMAYSEKRKQFLVDQGYAFEILIRDKEEMEKKAEHFNFKFANRGDELLLLEQVMNSDESGNEKRAEPKKRKKPEPERHILFRKRAQKRRKK